MTDEQALALKPGDTVYVTEFSCRRISDGFTCNPASVVSVDDVGHDRRDIVVRFPGSPDTYQRGHWAVHHSEADGLRDIWGDVYPRWHEVDRVRRELMARLADCGVGVDEMPDGLRGEE